MTIVAAGEVLATEQAASAMGVMMRGEASSEEIAGFLLGVTARGPTIDELAGFTQTMRDYAVPVSVGDPNAVDLCGTGGDGAGTFNVSTAAAFVCAGAGCTVAKHGNRSVSSRAGSADVLEALDVETPSNASGVEYCIEETGIGFIFAPFFHPAMKNVMPVRKSLGVRTFFNILGPLCNPAGVRRQLVGAYSAGVAAMIAGVLARLGADHVIAAHSEDGLDEISISAPTTLFEYRRRSDISPEERVFEPSHAGVSRYDLNDLAGGDARRNADIVLQILSGEEGAGREIVIVNSAHAIMAAGAADDLETAVAMARTSIDSGAAMGKLEALRRASRKMPRS